MKSTFSRTALVIHEKITERRILQRLEELNRTQWLSYDNLLNLQQRKLQQLLEYSYKYVPYYQQAFSKISFHPNDFHGNLDCLLKLPILTKSIIRENWSDLITTDPKRRRGISELSTSGSTGQPLVFMQDHYYRDSVTADIQRHMGWAGWKLGDLQAVIWGQSPGMSFRKRMRAKLIDWIWNRIQINAFCMTEKLMANFAKQIQQRNPHILFGYATCINQFAQYVRSSPYQSIRFGGVFSTAERLLPSIRHFIEETFRCKVFDRYGTLELGGIACECEEHTGLHLSMENNYVEIINNDNEAPAQRGEIGDIVVTNLNNFGMPFIRYLVGDAGIWYTGDDCSCGRSSKMLKVIEGRLVESFNTKDGRRIWAGFAGAGFRCLTHPSIKQFQIVQKSFERIVIRLVPAGEIQKDTLKDIEHAIHVTFGEDVVVDFEFLDKIKPLPSGKHQYAISELNNQETIIY